ncbi:MAG: class I SAM-dependent methyltransferase [Pseudomonadota bacterium]
MIWRLKILAKLVLSNLPIPYRIRNRLGLLRHGFMDDPDYIIRVFENHKNICFPDGLPDDFSVLELGPGDSLASMLIARAYGAKTVWLIDAGHFAHDDVDFYKRMAHALHMKNKNVPLLDDCTTIEDALKTCNATYLTNGLSDLQSIPDDSVDFIWSQAVLEHVARDEFNATQAELKRILKPGGATSHVIDFQDHLAHALNNLRFPEKVWESAAFKKSGFYTNRILASETLDRFRQSGFSDVDVVKTVKWDGIPTPKAVFAEQFQNLPDQDFVTKGITVRAH